MKRIFQFIFLLLLSTALKANEQHNIRLSLLTCGSGAEPWETFGHTAIRIVDSTNGTDNVYNYGCFNGYDEDFLVKFTRGKLNYYVSYYPYRDFLEEYLSAGRSVKEQVCLLPDSFKLKIYEFLNWNCLEENKNYKYDFFFDNCATRIRDLFPEVLGKDFKLGVVMQADSAISFRTIINQYFYKVHWQRFGVNLLLGSKIDRKMTNAEIMFLPDFLSEGLEKSRFKSQPIFSPSTEILPEGQQPILGENFPFMVMMLIAILTIASIFYQPMMKFQPIMQFLLLFLTGLIGCFIMFMWFGTDHQTCRDNFNVLWAFPTNLIFAFVNKRAKDKYVFVMILLLFVSLFLHVLKVQVLPLLELSPLLFALLVQYVFLYRKMKQVN